MTEPALQVDPSLAPNPARCALVWGRGLPPVRPSDRIPEFLARVAEAAKAGGEAYWPAGRAGRVRDMLRHGKYKPTGRGKPAQEFLLRTANEGNVPFINGPADANNAVSLESGFPASVFDADKTGWELLLRRGAPGEKYVFNSAGQEIDLQDLLLVCGRKDGVWVPCGNPVKDSMSTKVFDGATNVIAVIFAPAEEAPGALEAAGKRFEELLRSHCGAQETGVRLVG